MIKKDESPSERAESSLLKIEMKMETMEARNEKTLWQKTFPWVLKGTLAVMDQGLIAGSNFVVGILLARWLVPAEYGAYAVAFAVFLLLVMLYQSLLMEPVGVFGVSAYGERLRGYIKSLLYLHVATAIPVFLSLCIAAAIAFRLGQSDGFPGALLGLAFSAPCVLLFWLARRTFYLQPSPAPAVWGSGLYSALALAGLYLAFRFHLLAPSSAFIVMGIGAIGASAFLLNYLRLRLPREGVAPRVREVWQRHWHYGKWALGSAAMMWVPANIFYPVVSSFKGLTQAGELKALMNFATPMLQFYAAIALLLLPHATRVHTEQTYDDLRKAALRITILCVSGAVLYWAILIGFQNSIFAFLYSGRYTEVEYLMPVVAVASISWSAFFGPATVLRAMEAPAQVFWAVSIASCVSLIVGVPATKIYGVQGAAWAMAISETLAFLAAGVLLQRKLQHPPASARTTALPMVSEEVS